MNQPLILNDAKNWPDGDYLCKCSCCDTYFKGHKYQGQCRSCSPLDELIQTYISPIGAHDGDDYPKQPLSEAKMKKIVDEGNNDIETAADAICMIANSTTSTWSEVLDALTGPVFNAREAKEIRDYLK